MKKTLLSVLCLIALLFSVHAQPVLYSTTPYGGSANQGTIIKYNVATNTESVVKSFTGIDGSQPVGGLVEAPNGKLYGMTYSGGIGGAQHYYGVLYSFDPVTAVYTKLLDFHGPDGAIPYAGLILASDGKLYGMTSKGGSDFEGDTNGNIGTGVIFSFDPATNTYTKLLDFRDYYPDRFPQSPLIQAANGKLYGTTGAGGKYDNGVVFSFNFTTKTYKKLVDFGGSVEEFSNGGLTQASNGKIYGATDKTNSFFNYDPANSTFTRLFKISSIDGNNPSIKMVQATNGKLYGSTESGGSYNDGVIYSLNPVNNDYTKLYDFTGSTGSLPTSSLLQASNGKLYGITYGGGATGQGVIYSFDPTTNTFNKLHDFNGADGAGAFNSSFIEYHSTEACVPFTVRIPDVRVLPSGVQPNTVYHGYGPADSVTLTAQVSGGAANATYTYLWCDGETTSCIRVSPKADKHYTVIVTSTAGCSYSGGLQLKVVDVRCGDHLDKVKVCRRMPGNQSHSLTVCMDAGEVAAQLSNGATLGSYSADANNPAGLVIGTSPNPSRSSFTLFITGNASGEQVSLRVVNAFGRVVESRVVSVNQAVQIGASYSPGIYYIEVVQGSSKTSTKVIKQGR